MSRGTVQLYSFFNLGARGGLVVNVTAQPPYPRETRYPLYRRLEKGEARAGLGGCGKSRLPPGFEPQTFQSLASRYTDYANGRRTMDPLKVVVPVVNTLNQP